MEMSTKLEPKNDFKQKKMSISVSQIMITRLDFVSKKTFTETH